MRPDEIPLELVELMDRLAGKQHNRSGRAVQALAEVLTRYDEFRRTMKILVTGSRDATGVHENRIRAILQWVAGVRSEPVEIWTGGAQGADRLAAGIANAMGPDWSSRVFHADWTGECLPECPPDHRRTGAGGREYCPRAGHRRNQDMVDAGPDVVLAFPVIGATNRGTSDCAERSVKAGLPTLIFPLKAVPTAYS